MKLNKPDLLLLILLLIVINFTFLKIPLSQGDRYFHRLQYWYYLAQNGDWSTADKIAINLDSADISTYSRFHRPDEIQKTIDQIKQKEFKNADDWAEISSLEKSLGNTSKAASAAAEAYKLDPIRDDISKLYFSVFSSAGADSSGDF